VLLVHAAHQLGVSSESRRYTVVHFLELHGGSSSEDFIGQSPDMVHKDPTAVSIFDLSLEAMIPLGFVKGENS
jgi:hypothetical protein